jgi:hypothetical protein
MYKYEKNGSRTEIARSHVLPTDPVFTDVHVPGGDWFLEVCWGWCFRVCVWFSRDATLPPLQHC